MKWGIRRALAASAFSLVGYAMASCLSGGESATTTNGVPDGAVPFDASKGDASTANGDSSSPDASFADASVPDASVPDAMGPDAMGPDATLDAAPDARTDAAPDAASDAGVIDAAADGTTDAPPDATPDAAVDSSVTWQDAGIVGCVAPSGPSGLSPTAEGIPAAGLVLWLRADRGVYTLDAGLGSDAGAPPRVCAWADQSGKGWLFTGGTTNPPEWSSNGMGGAPAIGFPTANPSLGIAGVLGIGPTSPRTFIAVERIDATRGRFDPILQGQGGSPGVYISIDANTWQTVGDREGVYMTNNSFDTATATSAGTPRVHVMTITSMTVGDPVIPALDYRINGQTQTLTLRAGSGVINDYSPADFTAVGAVGTSSTGVSPSAALAEVIAYDRALSDTEKAAVETALKARYAIP